MKEKSSKPAKAAFKPQAAAEIVFTKDNATQHLASLFTQLREVFKDGRINLDRLNNVAHW
jgi:hypothetical protein